MSDNLSDKTALVWDNGLFACLAMHLSQAFNKNGFGRVLYHVPQDEAYPSLAESIIGDGLGIIERCDDPWEVVGEVDLFLFPNRGNIGPQLHLESIEKRVIGSRRGSDLETFKSRLRKLQAKLGMDVPPHTLVRGVTKLREVLKEREDFHIKVDRWRHDMETWHWRDWKQDEGELDKLAVRFGPFKELVLFLVEDAIETELEIGVDIFTVDGNYPNWASSGVEKKDKTYLTFLREYADLPDEIKAAIEPLSGTLRDFRYRNFMSTEQRVTEDKNYLTDFTARLGFPSGPCQVRLYANLPQLLWHGAAGELIDIEPAGKVAIECLMDHSTPETDWRSLRVDEDVLPWVNLTNPCKLGDVNLTPPIDIRDSCIGSVTGIGDDVKEAVEHVMEIVETFSGQPVSFKTECLKELVEEVEKASDKGIELSDEPMPEAEDLETKDD